MLEKLLKESPLVLMEAAVVEQLRRSGDIKLHPMLANAPLIYDKASRIAMQAIYTPYMELGRQAELPMLLCTPTWRAGQDRVLQSETSTSINIDAVHFMKEIRIHESIRIGGMIGCKNDCYLPNDGLSVEAAQDFHAWQIEQLVNGGVDFLIAETIPNINEALGIAKAMESAQIPYIISFVISRNGRVLDGTSLDAAIELIDAYTSVNPVGYMVNCAHPSFLRPAHQLPHTFTRLIGFQGNASSLDHCDLENADELKADSISEWGELMLDLNTTYSMKILGGCCGTGVDHLKYIVEHRRS